MPKEDAQDRQIGELPSEEHPGKKEWVNLTVAEKELGLSREILKSKIHNGCMPFRMVGSHYRINLKLAKAYLAKEDIQNMEAVKKEISINPVSRRKTNVRKICG